MSSRATVSIDDRGLLALIQRTTGPSGMSRVAARLKAEAETLAAEARPAFPVSRWASGAVKKKDHARDSITVAENITPEAIVYSVVSDSSYIYYVRSYQVGESEGERADRMRRRKGESDEDYDARRTVGTRRHAWSTLVANPGKRRSKQIAEDLAEDLRNLANGR